MIVWLQKSQNKRNDKQEIKLWDKKHAITEPFELYSILKLHRMSPKLFTAAVVSFRKEFWNCSITLTVENILECVIQSAAYCVTYVSLTGALTVIVKASEYSKRILQLHPSVHSFCLDYSRFVIEPFCKCCSH